MSRPGEPLDAFSLAAAGAVVERAFPIGEFERLADRLAKPGGTAQLRVAFERREGIAVGDLRLEATAELACRRCLGPVRRRLASESRVAFVRDEDAPVPDGREAFACDPRRLDLATLAEDELLLSLPLVAVHGPDEHCTARAAGEGGDAAVAAPPLRRPFAGLKDLLDH